MLVRPPGGGKKKEVRGAPPQGLKPLATVVRPSGEEPAVVTAAAAHRCHRVVGIALVV